MAVLPHHIVAPQSSLYAKLTLPHHSTIRLQESITLVSNYRIAAMVIFLMTVTYSTPAQWVTAQVQIWTCHYYRRGKWYNSWFLTRSFVTWFSLPSSDFGRAVYQKGGQYIIGIDINHLQYEIVGWLTDWLTGEKRPFLHIHTLPFFIFSIQFFRGLFIFSIQFFRGLFTSGRDSPKSVKSDKLRFPASKLHRNDSGSEADSVYSRRRWAFVIKQHVRFIMNRVC